ncbi:ankyrin repeat-containing domain protein [Chytridium lagenaria]|nr:ankyrin repeat-containing domain protein [Chytridium lagenaria]
MALLWACRFGREDLLSEILRLPKNLILRGNDDKEVRDITSIQEAERAASANLAVALLAEEGHAGCLRYLLDRVRVPTAYQPLNRQISSGETDATESVLQLSAARQSVGGETMSDEAGNPVITVDCSAFEHHALRMAAKNGHLEVMVVLTDKGKVDPAALGNYALRWAALNGHTEVTFLSLSLIAWPSSFLRRFFFSLVFNTMVYFIRCLVYSLRRFFFLISLFIIVIFSKVVRFLVAQESVDPSVPNDCAIRWASRNGHSEIVQILLDVGSQESTNLANYEDEKVGRAGLTREQLDSIRRRRSVKCDPSADDNDAIRWACLEGHTEVVRCLLDSGRVDPSAEKSEALRWACRNGHKGIVQLLLATGKVDVSAEDYEALKWAARNGHSEMVELLLGDTNVIENNVDANDLDSDGVAKDRMKRRMPKHVLAALQMSLQRGHMEVAKVILDAHSSS